MKTTRFTLLAILFFSTFSLKAQNNTSLIKVHPSIGDTVDEKENTKYNLFQNFPPGQFKYALYKMEKTNINVYLTLKNGTTLTLPYSSEKLLKDTEKIVVLNGRVNNEEKTEKVKPRWQMNLSLLGGAWIPTGQLANVGVHPNFGLVIGAVYSKLSIGLEYTLKLMKSSQPYLARRYHSNGRMEETTTFGGGYAGLCLGYDLVNTEWHIVTLLGGGGVDGFDALKSKDNLSAESITTSNFNIGLGYYYKFGKTKCIGLQVKYNYVDYTKSHIIDMKGQPITVQLEFGGIRFKKKDPLKKKQWPG